MMIRWKNYFLFALLCLIWSTTWSILKLGLEETPPMLGLACRFASASIIMIPFMIKRRKSIFLTPAHIRLYLMVGIFNMYLSYYFTYWGTQYISSGLSSIIWATFPLMIGIISYFALPSEKLSVLKLAAVALSVAGVVLIFSDDILLSGTNMVLGTGIVLTGVVVAAAPNVYVKKFKDDYDPLVLTCLSVTLASVLHFTGSYLFGEFEKMVWDLKNISIFLYLGIFGTSITFFIYYSLMKRISVTKLSFVTFIPPVFAVIIGAVFLAEIVTFKEIAGIVLIFIGVFLFDYNRYMPLIMKKNT